MRKNFVVKNFCLSRLQTIINYSISLWYENFVCLIFVVRGVGRKIFHAELFPNYGISSSYKYNYLM